MPALYVSEQGAVIEKEGETLSVRLRGERLQRLPVHRLERVLVFGQVQLTTAAISLLASHEVPVSYFSSRGRLKARVLPACNKNVFLRIKQYQRLDDMKFRLGFAQRIAVAKARNQRAVLLRAYRNHKQLEVKKAAQGIKKMLSQQPVDADISEWMGWEGAAARHYFRGFAQIVARSIPFESRHRRPAPDPVNALLEFTYSLIGNELAAVLESVGLDPYVGYYHSVQYGRPSLALDLLEEFRAPLADRFVLRAFNLKILLADDFETNPKGGVSLRPAALKRLLGEYEKNMKRKLHHPHTGQHITNRQLLVTQAQSLTRHVQGKEEYKPYPHQWR